MLSIVKTAIITITLSFISGVLLDHYRNIAPRILCKMGKGKVVRMNNKKMKMYNLTIKNSSKQTIHNLNVNLHAHYTEMQIRDTEITRGLKFNTSNENGGYDISIPFLSKNDEFSIRVFTECVQGASNKPVVTLRSPEKFKRVDSSSNKNDKIDKRKTNDSYSENSVKSKDKKSNKFIEVFEKIAGNKKAVAAILTALCLLFAVVLVKEYVNKNQDKNTSSYLNKGTSNNETKNEKPKKNIDSGNSNKNESSDKTESTLNNNYSSSGSQNTNNSNNTEGSNQGTKDEGTTTGNTSEGNNSGSTIDNNTVNNTENNNTSNSEPSSEGSSENGDSSNSNSGTTDTDNK